MSPAVFTVAALVVGVLVLARVTTLVAGRLGFSPRRSPPWHNSIRLARVLALFWAMSILAAIGTPEPRRVIAADVTVPLPTWMSGGRSDIVSSVAFSPDGKRVLLGSVDRTATLWDAATGKLIRTFDGHTEPVTSVCFSPDGTRILTGSADRTAKLWNTETGDLLRTFTGQNGSVSSVAFNSDDTHILTGCTDGSAKLWNANTGTPGRIIARHTRAVSSVAFSADGKWALTGSLDATAILWDEAWKPKHTFRGHGSPVFSVCFSPDRTRVLTGSGDATAKLWDADTGKLIHTLTGHDDALSGVAFSKDSKRVLTGSVDRTAKVWNADTGKVIGTLRGHTSAVSCVAFSTDDKQILTGSRDKTAVIWNADTGTPIRLLGNDGHRNSVQTVSFTPYDGPVLTGSFDGTAKLWGLRTGESIRTFQGHTGGVTSAVYSPNRNRALVLTGSTDGTAKIWNADTGAVLRTFSEHSDSVTSVAFSSDGTQALTGSKDGTAIIWNADSGTIIRIIPGHGAPLTNVAFMGDSKRVFTGSRDWTVKVWETDTGVLLRTLKGPSDFGVGASCLAFSPEGDRVVTGTRDGVVRVWDVATAGVKRTLNPKVAVNCVCFSPNGHWLLTGQGDDTARVWDAHTGKLLRTLPGHKGSVMCVAFSATGDRVLTGGSDGTVKMWDVGELPITPFEQPTNVTEAHNKGASGTSSTLLSRTDGRVIAAVVPSVVLPILFFVWLGTRLRSWQKHLRAVERTMHTNPTRAMRQCERAVRRLRGMQPTSRRGRETRLNALALAYVLTATLHYRKGLTERAQNSLDLALGCAKGEKAKCGWSVKYHLGTGCATAEAVEQCLAYLREPWQADDMPSTAQVMSVLRSSCRITPELTGADLTTRVRWNQEAQKSLPDELWPQVHEGQAWQRLGRPERAQRVLDDVLARDPDNWEARAFLARVRAALGQHDLAKRDLDELQQQFPDDPEVLLEVARNRAAIGDYAGAQGMGDAIKRHPDYRTPVEVLIGQTHLRQGQPQQAIPLLRGAVERSPDDVEALLSLAEALGQTAAHTEVAQLFRKAPKSTNTPRVQFAHGSALLNGGEALAAAAELFAECAQVGYRVRLSRLLRVRCLIRCREYDLASATLEELGPADREDPEVAFLIGVVTFGLGAPGAALPYFSRTFNAATASDNRSLAARAAANIFTCQLRIAEAFVDEKRFEAAANAYSAALQSLPQDHPSWAVLSRNVSECYLRAAVSIFPPKDRRGPGQQIGAEVIALVEWAAAACPRPPVDALLAGLYFSNGRYSDAVAVYDRLRWGVTESDQLDYHWALAAARIGRGNSPDASAEPGSDTSLPIARLIELATEAGPLSTRAALALAALERESGNFRRAGEILVQCLSRPSHQADAYHAEACGQAVLNQWRAGDIPAALAVCEQLFGTVCRSPALVLGTLIAGEGDDDGALPHLVAALPPGVHPGVGWSVLRGVCLRVASRQCLRGDLADVRATLEIGLARQSDPALEYFHRLTVEAMRSKAASGDELEERVLGLLGDLQKFNPRPEPLLVQSQLVSQHRRACTLAFSGDHDGATKFWNRAQRLWDECVRKNTGFWSGYIAAYNNGQEYELQMRPEELEKSIATRVVSLYIGIAVGLLEDRTARESGSPLETAKSYLGLAGRVINETHALSVFSEQFPVGRIIKAFPGAQLRDFYAVFSEVCETAGLNPEHRDGWSYILERLVIYSLNDAHTGDFFEHLKTWGRIEKDIRGLAEKCRRLGKQTIKQIIIIYREHPRARELASENREEADRRLLRVVFCVANLFAEHSHLYDVQNYKLSSLLRDIVNSVLKD